MTVKLFEVRDRMTFIPVICVDMNPMNDDQRYLLRRCGYACDGYPNILFTRVRADGDRACNDPHYWNDRTFQVAHTYILEHWHELHDGEVIDVEFILGETKEKKLSERVTT